MIGMQAQVIEDQKKAMEAMTMEMTEMIGMLQAEVAELKGVK